MHDDAGEVLTIGVVEHMKNKRCELKNLVTAQEYRRQGYGTYMVNYLSEYYSVTCVLCMSVQGTIRIRLIFINNVGLLIHISLQIFL